MAGTVSVRPASADGSLGAAKREGASTDIVTEGREAPAATGPGRP